MTLPKPMTSNAKAAGRFGKQDFVYVAADDVYICPARERLTYRYSSEGDGKMMRRYWTDACKSGYDHRRASIRTFADRIVRHRASDLRCRTSRKDAERSTQSLDEPICDGDGNQRAVGTMLVDEGAPDEVEIGLHTDLTGRQWSAPDQLDCPGNREHQAKAEKADHLEAVEGAFGADVDYAQLVKLYGAVSENAKGPL